MHRALGFGLVALLATAWMVAVSEPGERPAPQAADRQAGWVWSTPSPKPADAAVDHFPVKLDWRPSDVLCAGGTCTPLESMIGWGIFRGDRLYVPSMSSPSATHWSLNLSLTGTALPNGLQPVIVLEAMHPCRGGEMAGAAADRFDNYSCYREIQRSQGAFPLRLDLPRLSLQEGDVGVRLTLLAAPPKGANGLSQATLWHLEGEVQAFSPTLSA